MPFSAEFMKEVERWGWRLAIYSVLMSTVRRRFVLCALVTRPLTGNAEDAASGPAEHRFVTKSELIEFAQHLPDHLKHWALEQDPDEFNKCWGAFLDGKLVAMTWRAYQHVPAGDGLMAGFQTPYRYGLKAYTLPEYRGKHLLVSNSCDPHCRAKGYTHAISFIETHNFPSRRRQRRRGSSHAGYAGYFKIGNSVVPFRTPLARKHTFRFYKPE